MNRIRPVRDIFDPLPVTDLDRETKLEGLEWFTRQGGRVDRSSIPDTKPAIQGIQVGDDGTIWVQPTRSVNDGEPGVLFEIFGPEGPYPGPVRIPFSVRGSPIPIIRGGWMVMVSQDKLDLQARGARRSENY